MIEALAFLASVAIYSVGYLHGRGHRWISNRFGRTYTDPNPYCNRCDLQMVVSEDGRGAQCVGCGLGCTGRTA